MPSTAFVRAVRTRIVAGAGGGAASVSSVPGTMRAPHSSTSRRLAMRRARSGSSTGRPFSNRPLDSDRRPSASDVRRMVGPSNAAASSSRRVVPSFTSTSSAPMMPAMTHGRSASQMASMSGLSARLWPSRVVTGSPSPARRTTTAGPAMRSRSNACSGWPVSSIT